MRLILIAILLLALSACDTPPKAKHVRCVTPNGEVIFEADNVEVWEGMAGITVRKNDGHYITIYGFCTVEY